MPDNVSPPGWFADHEGRTQWWDGERWTGQFLEDQPAGGGYTPPSVGCRIGVAVASVATLVLLGVVLLLWVGRGDRVADLAVTMAGPFVGVVIGSTISTRKSRAKAPKRWPVWGYVVVFVVLNVLWLTFVAGVNGGLDGDVVVPLVVLTVLGTAVMTTGSKLTSPESFR